MPLVLCPNCNEGMKEIERHGVRVDICPTCRGVWLDRGELEKLLGAAREAAAEEDAAMAPQAPPPSRPGQPAHTQGPPQGWQQPAPPPQSGWPQQPPPAYGHPYYRKKKKRFFDDLFDIFD